MNIKYIALLSLVFMTNAHGITRARIVDQTKKEWHDCLQNKNSKMMNCDEYEEQFQCAKREFETIFGTFLVKGLRTIEQKKYDAKIIGQEEAWQKHQFDILLYFLSEGIVHHPQLERKAFDNNKENTQKICNTIIDELSTNLKKPGIYWKEKNHNYKLTKTEVDKAAKYLKDIIHTI